MGFDIVCIDFIFIIDEIGVNIFFVKGFGKEKIFNFIVKVK